MLFVRAGRLRRIAIAPKISTEYFDTSRIMIDSHGYYSRIWWSPFRIGAFMKRDELTSLMEKHNLTRYRNGQVILRLADCSTSTWNQNVHQVALLQSRKLFDSR